MKNETSSIHDWELHSSINGAKVERNDNIINLISEYLDIPYDFVTPESKIFILGIMASILHEEGIFFKNKKPENIGLCLKSLDEILKEGLNCALSSESFLKKIAILKAEEKYHANKTRTTYEALFLNYNVKETEMKIIGLIQKVNEIAPKINLLDIGAILDITVEDFLEE